MADSVGVRGPVPRTLLLVLHSGPVDGMVTNNLRPECVEGLLSYARLFFAQPHSGKLSTLGAAGRRVHTVTNWDPGQQSVDAILKGLDNWKPPVEDEGFDIKHTLKEVTHLLYESTSNSVTEMAVADKATPATCWEVSDMLRTRLMVILPQDSQSHLQKLFANRVKTPDYQQLLEILRGSMKHVGLLLFESGAGSGIHPYHKYMLEALSGLSKKEAEIETTFLDVTMSASAIKPIMITAAASGPVHLATTYYKLLPSHASDLFIDLAYFHLELTAIAVKGMLPHLQEVSGDNSGILAVKEREMEDEDIEAVDTVIRLVLCHNAFLPAKHVSKTLEVPGSPSFRGLRTMSLTYIKSTLSTSQLLALPCASVAPTLPEVFQRGSTAQLWDNLKHQNNDKLSITLSSEQDTGNITHFFMWRDGRFWLHTISRSEDRSHGSTTVADLKGEGSHGESEGGASHQDIAHTTVEVLLTMPPQRVGHLDKTSVHSAKKRKQEETDDSVSQGSQNQATWRHRRSGTHPSKQMERQSRWFSGTSSDVIISGPERYSLQLAGLVSPIRGAFLTEDLPGDHVSNASKCITKLLDHTESNDISLFPLTVDLPSARRELYKKVWRELDGLAKQALDKSRGQEDLAHAIAIAGAEYIAIEERAPIAVTQPVLSEKPAEFAPVNKRRRCEEVPRDVQGRPVFPIKLGPSLQVYNLGKIVWNRPNFHSEKYIWPAGYKSRRAYASMLNSENRIFYWCEIVDDGQAPEFRLTPEDDQDNPVVGISATAVWTVVVKRVGALRIEEGGKKTFANVSGPEYFGYANPTIARLIQQLPDAEKCTKYRRQEYLPNVPMRTVDTEIAQGAVVPEGSVSPLSRDFASQRTPPLSLAGEDVHVPNPLPVPASVVRESAGAAPLVQDEAPAVELEEHLHSPAGATCREEEEKPLSWLMEFRITSRLKEVGNFPQQFAGCSPGSLFNHYWSAKLRRLRSIELDGRQ